MNAAMFGPDQMARAVIAAQNQVVSSKDLCSMRSVPLRHVARLCSARRLYFLRERVKSDPCCANELISRHGVRQSHQESLGNSGGALSLPPSFHGVSVFAQVGELARMKRERALPRFSVVLFVPSSAIRTLRLLLRYRPGRQCRPRGR
jgi:hypothetical protein